MARIRTIKPEFFTDRKIATELTRDQRLFYEGMWCQADDEGRMLDLPRRLLGEIFPHDDDLDTAWARETLDVLASTKRITRYEIGGEHYIQLMKFRDHQVINRPTKSRIPPPPNYLEDTHGDNTGDSGEAHGGLSEDSRSTHGDTHESLLQSSVPGTEEQGNRGTEEQRKKNSGDAPEFDLFWSEYPRRAGSNSKTAARRKWKATLRKAGVDPPTLIAAAKRYRAYTEATGSIGTEFVMQASKFLGPDEHWREEWAPPPPKPGAVSREEEERREAERRRTVAKRHSDAERQQADEAEAKARERQGKAEAWFNHQTQQVQHRVKALVLTRAKDLAQSMGREPSDALARSLFIAACEEAMEESVVECVA